MEIGLNMSLDDYIKKATEMNIFKNNTNFITSAQHSDALYKRTDYERNEERVEKDDYDDDDDVLMIEDEDTLETIWRGPSSKIDKLNFENNTSKKEEATDDHSEINNNGFDLRDKLDKPTEMHQPNLKSQNWRLMRPNVNFRRPPGMPPIVPKNSAFRRNSGFFANRNGNNSTPNNFKEQFMGIKHNKFGKNWHNNKKGQRGVKNAQHRYNNNSNNYNGRETLFQLTLPTLKKLNGNNKVLLNSDILNPNTKSNFDLNGVTSACQTNQNKNLQDLFGLGSNDINTAMMPQIASKVLDMIRGASQPLTHKPIYDMNVHKEISEIQRKPFIYNCGGAAVVSSDGPGINNVFITPQATHMSMNFRFA